MYLVSRHAGWGRNFWIDVDDGTVDIHTSDEHLHVKVHNKIVVEQTSRTNEEYTTLRYGQECKTRKGSKTVKEEYFQPRTLQAIRRGGLWKKQTGIQLCGNKGTVECYSTSGGAYGKEIFRYDNGAQAYIATRWRKNLQVRHPNGKLWMVVKGKVVLNREPIAEKLDSDGGNLDLWRMMRRSDWELTVYDTSGVKVVTQGHVKNRQKEGKWLEHSKETYYISGVQVSRQIYEGDPNKWDGYDVLRIPNAQLRCSLLNRMGYNRLLEKVKGKVIDTSADGGQLLEIDSGLKENNGIGLDSIMRLAKVICPSTGQIYVLRVPPGIANYEQARQWTFGLRMRSLEQGARFDLVKET
jgi:hypothetical protein